MSQTSSKIYFSLKPEGRSYLLRHDNSLYKLKIALKISSPRLLLMDKDSIQDEIQNVVRNILWLESSTSSGDFPKEAVILTTQLAIHIRKQPWTLAQFVYFQKTGKKFYPHASQYIMMVQCRRSWMERKKEYIIHSRENQIKNSNKKICEGCSFQCRIMDGKHSIKKNDINFKSRNFDPAPFQKFKENKQSKCCLEHLTMFTPELESLSNHMSSKRKLHCCACPEELLTSNIRRRTQCGGCSKCFSHYVERTRSSKRLESRFKNQDESNQSIKCQGKERIVHSTVALDQKHNIFKSLFNAFMTPVRMFKR